MSDVFVDPNEVDKAASHYYPAGSIAVKLSSLGKLSAPTTVHVSDYSPEDAMKMSMAQEDELLENLVQVLKHIVHDDFDVLDLHEKEAEEILLTIKANFWSKVIEGVPFPYTQKDLDKLEEDDPEKAEKIRNGSYTPMVDIPVSDIETANIDSNFKKPITIKMNGREANFMLPRIRNYIIANEHIRTKYANEEKDFEMMSRLSRKGVAEEELIDRFPVQRIKDFEKYSREKFAEYLRIQQAWSMIELDGEPLETIEDKLNAYSHIPLKMWEAYMGFVQEFTFGVNEKIKVKSPLTGSKVTRRFQFRITDFLKTSERGEPSSVDISFG